MSNLFPTVAVAVIASAAGSIGTAFGQMPPFRDVRPRPPSSRPPASDVQSRQPSTQPPVVGPALTGYWSGTVLQIQQSIEYTVRLEISAHSAEITYPELHCGGKLSRMGTTQDYAFFVEATTNRTFDGEGLCASGTMTMARAGDGLAWGWFGLVKGEIFTAYGTLMRKSDADQQSPLSEEGQLETGAPRPSSLRTIRGQRTPAKASRPSTDGTPPR